jgi:hypothetical protein
MKKDTPNMFDWDLLLGVLFFALVIFLYTLTPW